MTMEEMLNLNEGDVVYCIQTSLSHSFHYGQKLTRFYTEGDEYDNVCFRGDGILQYLTCDEISLTNLLIDKND